MSHNPEQAYDDRPDHPVARLVRAIMYGGMALPEEDRPRCQELYEKHVRDEWLNDDEQREAAAMIERLYQFPSELVDEPLSSEAMRAEALQRELEAVVGQVNKSSLPAIEIFTDPVKRELYDRFLQTYCGEPFSGADGVPEITRERGGQEVQYNYPIMTGLTQSGSHMLHVREARGSGVSSDSRYFVATGDFGTGDFTEWIATRHPETDGFVLTLSQRNLEVARPIVEPKDRSYLELLRAQRIQDIADARNEANKITFEISDGRAQLSWGNFRVPEKFVSLSQLESELLWLQCAQEAGLLGATVDGSTLELVGEVA